MNLDLIKKILPLEASRIEMGLCPTCGGPVHPFRDALSEKEFKISGMCQSCQDKVFGA